MQAPLHPPKLPDDGLEPQGARLSFAIQGPAVPRARAWQLVGDTDWLNRVAGNGHVISMDIASQRDGLPVLKGELAGPMGLRLPFEEAWTSWARGLAFRQVRAVQSPLLNRIDYEAQLQPEGDHVRPALRLALDVPAYARPIAAINLSRIRGRWQRALDSLAEAAPRLRELPSSAREACRRWAGEAGAELVGHFEELFASAQSSDLRELRSAMLARRWGRDRSEVLDALLLGVDAGAVELYWSVRCDRCYGQVSASDSLSDLADHASCPSCKIDFSTDLSQNVEVLFSPHPAVVPRSQERFCTLFPAGAPDQYAVFTLGPGQRATVWLDLPPGEYRLGPGRGRPDDRLLVEESGPSSLAWASDLAGIDHALGAGLCELGLHNLGEGRQRLSLTRVGGEPERTFASALTTHPLFRRRFGAQVLARDLRISTRFVVLLFTDLTGSTALYEEAGDAGAFAYIRDHFALLREVVEEHGGVVVKTIGDAVMAAFDQSLPAMKAALAMQERFGPWSRGRSLQHPPRLKVGLHGGAALVVHSPQSGLDYFGGTVNVAARAQGAAGAGEVVWTASLERADPALAAWVQARGLRVERFEGELKGIHGPVALRRCTPA